MDSIYLPEAPIIGLTGDSAGCLNGSGFDATFVPSFGDTVVGHQLYRVFGILETEVH